MKRLRIFVTRLVAEPTSWFRSITQRGRLEAEMEAELAMHLDSLAADLIRAGYSPRDAARRARIALGSLAVHKDGMRLSLGLRLWDELDADLRYGVRRLRRSVGFTAVAALSLALAIGANTTIFSLAKQLLYAKLHLPHPENLRMLCWNGDGKEAVNEMWGDFDPVPGGGMKSSVFSYAAYKQLRDHNSQFEDLFAFKEDSMNETIRGNARRAEIAMVSGNFFSALQVPAQLGRTIQPLDDALPAAGAVAMISDRVWEREFGRSEAVLGQTIRLNQATFTIVGVSPRGFTGAKNVQGAPDAFVPLAMQPVIDPKGKSSLLEDSSLWWLNIDGRLKSGASEDQARTELQTQLAAVIRGTMTVKAGETIPRLVLADGSRGLAFADRMFRKPIFVLMGFTGFVLLLACTNIANLLLARGAQRQREMSVRLAMGAGRLRILRQLLTESLLLAALGGAGGLLLGYLGRNVLPNLLTNAWESNEFSTPFDWGVFAFTGGVAILTGILFGLAPAWLAGRTEVGSHLKESAQAATHRRRGFAGKAVVAFQIALSTLLVVGAGLFLRTLFALNSVDVGFQPDHLLLFEIDPPAKRYPPGKDLLLHSQLEQGFAGVPGVDSVAPGWQAYLSDNMSNEHFMVEGDKVSQTAESAEDINAVGNRFFQTMGIPILAGRSFGPQDTSTSAKVAVISRALARKRFPNANPIGKRFKTDDFASIGWIEIVGICGDTRLILRSDPPPQFFLPYVQQPQVGGMVYQIRTRLDAPALTPALRRVVQSIDPDLPMIDVRTQREQIEAGMQMERTFASLTVSFGVLALALACVGIYGVMSYSVANRTNEIGIRLALGALPEQVLGMILREAVWVSLAGVAAGLAAALLLAQAIKSMLYGLRPADPVSLISGAALLIAVGLGASWLPASRAASVEPMEALWHE